ncbi:rRNA methyltransferase [Patiriisocius marinistellae]|uniref:rRNA methyltransferase n=1 Tax=Patiriisocius marinistellae TaxID=2494560 RepID=A0A5J4FV80_9FLAO|nr:RNA methyltransferase [Patiriisocius marinistellae]GEQ85870.1 rRNA methyltransferase [Patiriisocius marinistellae]
MHKKIDSPQNTFIKKCLFLLDKSRERKKTGTFIIEGEREIMLAIKGGYSIKTILFCSEIFFGNLTNFKTQETEIIEVSLDVYQKLAYRSTTEGIIAIAKSKALSLKDLKFQHKNPLILISEAPEKPGNIGAILRTADAANVDAFIIANPKTDLYNPNIIRSSVGCVFTNNIATGTTEEIIDFLKINNISFYSAILQEAVNYDTCDYTKPTAIVVGTEATGLSEKWRTASNQNIKIPMNGEIDSMNVSVAAGILIFEAKRQRGFLS